MMRWETRILWKYAGGWTRKSTSPQTQYGMISILGTIINADQGGNIHEKGGIPGGRAGTQR
nr:hypothetical protein [uncultured Ilyobacter sp.]